MDDTRVFGYCEYCGDEITDKNEEYYVDSEGRIFCSVECICEQYGLAKVEV